MHNDHQLAIRKLEDEHAGIVTDLKLKNENTIVN